ncbi:MAG: CARDB domain-containing protein [Nitrospirota bacterium]
MMKHAVLCILVAASFLPVAHAAPAPGPAAVPAVVGDRPGGIWDGPPVVLKTGKTDVQWPLRTGLKKGVMDQTLDDEVFAAPDAAILANGSFREWTSLLADYHEASVLVSPDAVAALSATKPVLIIPSGGLAGLSASAFFRAGLAEYVRSGGIILCFTQLRGADFSALPVPAGQKLEAAGWTEDTGSLFRSSRMQDTHAVLSGMRDPAPAVETDGYLLSYPADAQVLLARQDGHPTLILYPAGKGWVAVTTLMSDVSFGQGLLHPEEKTLVRNMVLWAKSGGALPRLQPGRQFTTNLKALRPQQGEAASARVMIMGPDGGRPKEERTLAIAFTGPTATLPFSWWIPVDMPAGIYHLEYTLVDANKRQLSPAAESAGTWLHIAPDSPLPPRLALAPQPLAPLAARFSTSPSVGHAGDRWKIRLDIARTSGPAAPYDLIARVGQQEKAFTITRDRTTVTFELPAEQAGDQAAYAVASAGGRSIARGSILLAAPLKAGLSLDRALYLPGQKIKVAASNMGLGALTLTGLGTVLNQHISANKTFEIPVPEGLPAGTYPLAWEFQTRAGDRTTGELSVAIQGSRVVCVGSEVRPPAGGVMDLLATLRLASSHAVQAVVNVWPVGPDGTALPGQEKKVPLGAGTQEVPVSVPFKPAAQAGIWQLGYTVTAQLPEGAGFSPEPVVLASGRTLFDIGGAAVLGISLDRPVYYEPSGPAAFSAVIAGTEPVTAELFLDGKRIRREKIEAAGTTTLTVPLAGLAPGRHTVKAVAAVRDLESGRGLAFLYGARLPDLAALIRTSDVVAPVLEIGISIVNRGKVASGHSHASLYEGDPDKDGTLIEKFLVPPLEPGRQHVVVVKLPLGGKAGQRTLFAVADSDRQTLESVEDNNTASISLSIPDIMLTLIPGRTAYRSDEQIQYRVAVVNFTAGTLESPALGVQITDPSGRTQPADTVNLGSVASGDQKVIDMTLDLPVTQEGTYLIGIQASSAGKVVAADSLGISVLPTLLLSGSLEGTPSVAALCRPLTIRYRARNTGNITPTNGALKIEIRSSGLGQLVYAQQLPYSLDAGTVRIDKLDAPRGAYTVSFRGSATNQQRALTAEFLLAEQPLTVTGQAEVQRSAAVFPRILAWSGSSESTAVERAVTEKILKEAFESEPVHLKTVSTAEQFESFALTGMYNAYLLLEIDGLPDIARILRNGLAKGNGVIVIGSGEHSRALAEALDFRFGDPLPGGGSSIVFPPDSAMGITGTFPTSGKVLPPRKRGARTMAAFPDGRPAILADKQDKGLVIVMPFSLTRSALQAGTTNLYSLLVRSAAAAATPEQEGSDDLASLQLSVSSPSGPVKTEVRLALPPGAQILWTSDPHTLKNGSLTFALTAESEARSILSLFRGVDPAKAKIAAEVFTECGGKMVSQGKVE